MDINEDVVIVGKLTVAGPIEGTSVKSNQDLIAGRNIMFDGQSDPVIDNDSNAKLTAVTASGLVLTGSAPSIPNATSEADAVVKLNALLTLLRSAGTIT